MISRKVVQIGALFRRNWYLSNKRLVVYRTELAVSRFLQ